VELVVTVVTLAMAFVVLFTSDDARIVVLSIGLGAVAAGLLVVYTIVAWRSELERAKVARARRWADGMRGVADAALTIAGLHRLGPSDGSRAALDRASQACTEFSKALSAMAGSTVRVTVKEIYVTETASAELAVRTIVFPSGAVVARDAPEDLVAENTDFREILAHRIDYFLSNNLLQELKRGYRNSHWTRERLQTWARTGDYPYRSTLVWPVRGARIDQGQRSPEWETVGFLCADTPSRHAFDRQYDVSVGEIIARALYGAWPLIAGPMNGGAHVPALVG